MSATLHHLPIRRPTRLAVRRFHGLAFTADGSRVELDLDAVDQKDADNQFFDYLAAVGVFPVRWKVSPVTGAAVGENIDTEPTGNATLDNPAVPGPVQVREAARQARRAERSAQQQQRRFMRVALPLVVAGSAAFWFGAVSLVRMYFGGLQ
jgi:hypothetical protein